MEEPAFYNLADATLSSLAETLEASDSEGDIEVEYNNGVLTVTLRDGKQLVVNRHTPSRQIWLSSPSQGGLHFSWHEATQEWRLPDGRNLTTCLQPELHAYLAD